MHSTPRQPAAPGSSTRRLRRGALKVLLSLLFTLLLLECGSAAIILGGRFPANVPSYELPTAQEPFSVDIDPHFGAWHMPGATRRHVRACFDVTYRTNSYGAQDVERPRDSAGSRTVVLGDSFTVGHGVDRQRRYSDRLEHLTGIPHLNFAAGGTYPTQYLLVYKHLAKQFSHDRLIVGILPDNDFDEGPVAARYRPYWEGEHPNYALRYSLPRVEDSPQHPSKHRGKVTTHELLSSLSFFYSAADYVAGYRKMMNRRPDRVGYAGYFDFTDEQMRRMRYVLEQMQALAPGGRMAVLAMPRLIDLERYKAERKNPFGTAMTPIAREVGFDFIDLLPAMAEAFAGRERDIFLGCDGHFSPEGHDFAANALRERLYGSAR